MVTKTKMTYDEFRSTVEARHKGRVGYDEVGRNGWTTLDEFPDRIKTGQPGPHWTDAHPIPRGQWLLGRYDHVKGEAEIFLDRTVRFIDEFGPEYRPPPEIIRLIGTELEDHSWHNDVCPMFGVADAEGDVGLAIWSDAERPEDREDDGPRFSVVLYRPDGMHCADVARSFETDDVNEAVVTYRRWRDEP